MRYYEDYKTDAFWEDNDNQDGTYFRDYEKPYKEEYTFGSDRDQTHKEKKLRAALYIRAHFKKLMKDEAYKEAYYKIIDEFARELSYVLYKKPLTIVSDEQRELESFALDFEIAIQGKRKINKYKEDAIYIVDLVRQDKSLIVYEKSSICHKSS